MLTWNDDAPQFVSPEERELLASQEQAEKRQVAAARRWAQQFDLWGLTRTQRRLFSILYEARRDGAAANRFTLLQVIYRIKPRRKISNKQKVRHYARLRQLQKRLNDKLRLARTPYEVKPWRKYDALRLVDTANKDNQDDEGAKGATQAMPGVTWEFVCEMRCCVGPPMDVEECKYFLSKILAGGPVPVWTVKQQLREKKCRPGTLKRARKQLGIVRIRQGYGSNGEWLMRLPDRIVTE